MASTIYSEATALCIRSMDLMTEGSREDFEPVYHPEGVNREAAVEPPATRQPGPAGFWATAEWLRAAFSGLRFEIHEILAEGQTVACRSTMTGTHQGPLNIGPMAALPVTGARIEVPHMHFFHYDQQGRVTDLWHVWNTLLLARQLGAPAPDLRIGTTA